MDSANKLLSAKKIPPRERLIFALDLPTVDAAQQMVDTLGENVQFYKLGLELFMAGGYFELVDALTAQGKKVFVDLKFFRCASDGRTRGATAGRKKRVSFTTVHGNDAILEAACSAKGDTKILAVTVLTSLDAGDLKDLGFQCEPKELVLSRARRALAIGCDGVISSGLEAADLRRELGDRLLIVTPGIRPVANVDDQKRVVSVEQAFLNGADYIVVGRPIKNAPRPPPSRRRHPTDDCEGVRVLSGQQWRPLHSWPAGLPAATQN